MGAVSPVGATAEESWDAVKNGRSGIDRITLFDATDYPVKIAAEVKNFDITRYGLEKRDVRKMARFTQFLLCASIQAVNDSGYNRDSLKNEKAGVMVGNCIGGLDVIEAGYQKYFDPKAGPSRIPPLTTPMMIINEAAANVSMYYGLNGLSWTLGTACASGTDALGAALDLIRSGRLDVCISGGTEAAIDGFGVASFTALQARLTKTATDLFWAKVLQYSCLRNLNTQKNAGQKSMQKLQDSAHHVTLTTLQPLSRTEAVQHLL